MIGEITRTVTAYASALDELNVPELEAVLTEDTTWTFAAPGQGAPGPVTGRAAVLEFVRNGHRAQTGTVRHHLSNVVPTATGGATAQVRAHLLQTRNTGDGIHVIATGVYTFTLRRSADGWRIAELSLALDSVMLG